MFNKNKPTSRRELTAARNEKSKIASQSKFQTGFKSGQTISGYQQENSERSQARELIVKRRKLSTIFVGFLTAIAVIIFVLAQIVIKAEFVTADNLKIKDDKTYAEVVENYYQDHPIERLRLFLNKDQFLSALQEKSPEIENVEGFSFQQFTSYNIKLKMRQPVAVWTDDDKEYFVDKTGVAFKINYYNQPNIVIADESGIKTSGNVVASNSFLSFVGKAIGASNDRKMDIERIVIPPASLRQVEIYLKGVDYPAKFLTTASPEGQIVALRQSMDYFEKNGFVPQYVDLRVEGKAVYKL